MKMRLGGVCGLAAVILIDVGCGNSSRGSGGAVATSNSTGAGNPTSAGSTTTVTTTPAATTSGPGSSGSYDIVDQPPGDAAYFYPHGLVSTPLPNAGNGGPTAHLMPNSDAVIATLLTETATGEVGPQPGSSGAGGFLTGGFASPGADDGGQVPLYFGTSTDVVYKPINVKNCGPLFAPMAKTDSQGYITNLTFHAPAGAYYSGHGGGSDNEIGVWDVSGEGISAGKVVGFYACCGSPTSFPACPGIGADGAMHAGTEADPCTVKVHGPAAGGYCSYADPVGGSGFAAGSGADGSNTTGPYSAWPRYAELVAGHIQHATDWNTNCEATAGGAEPLVVFPATGFGQAGSGALKCSNQSALAPPNGALYFLDYTSAQLDCLNPAKPACMGADGKPIAKLDPLHYVFVEQLALYGGYQSDTAGPATTPGTLDFYHVEASESYLYYSEHGFPSALTGTCPDCYGSFESYFNAHCSGAVADPTNWCYVNKRQPPSSAYAWETRIFYNLPKTFPGPTCPTTEAAAGRCGVGKHLHIADPCVAVSMAGLPMAKGGNHVWSACP